MGKSGVVAARGGFLAYYGAARNFDARIDVATSELVCPGLTF